MTTSPVPSLATRVREQVADRYMALSSTQRAHVRWLCGAVALFSFHYAVWCWPQPFFIEDSAISFSYARNFMEGKGMVPYPNGERIEGYSNPLWTILIGLAYGGGVEPWYSSKIIGYVFGILTLFLSYGIARRAQGLDTESPENQSLSWAPVVPAYLLAASTQFVLWNASGLENSLFNLTLALGIYWTLRESEEDRIFPWSALGWLGLCLTRPEGMAYACVGLLARVCITVWRGGVHRKWQHWPALLLWVLVLVVPFGLYQAWRYEYFAWLWPNTYYAKEKTFKPFNWAGGGWPKLREYMHLYGIIYASPAILLGLTGFSRWRRVVGAVLLMVMAGFILWDGKAGIPAAITGSWSKYMSTHWSEWRVYFLLGVGMWLGLTTMGWKGWEARTLLWATYCTGLFFQIFSGGDWMKGYRWFSLTSVPQFILLGVGISFLAELIPWSKKQFFGQVSQGWGYAVTMVIVLGALNVPQSYDFALDAETAVRDVHQRVRYMTGVQRRLELDSVTLLDVDMGAHMWYTDWHILDLAGLIDVPVARHDWQKTFSEDYILNEYRPEFAHVHGAWARSTKITDLQRFKDEYLEIPGFPSGGKVLHVGNHIRKDILVRPQYEGPAEREVRFGADSEGYGGVVLEGWSMPAPEVASGGKLYLATTWTAGARREGEEFQKLNDFRVHVAFTNSAGETHVAEVVPGYDWYAPNRWKEGEHVIGNWGVPVPEEITQGVWEVRLSIVESKSGRVLEAPPGATEPRYMRGEVLLHETFKLVSFQQAHDTALSVLDAGIEQGKAGACSTLHEAWKNARRHVARDTAWHDAQEGRFVEAMVDCLILKADAETIPEEKAPYLMKAQDWLGQTDRTHDRITEIVTPVGEALEALGDERAAKKDWEGAFRAFSAAVKVDPRRSWARRKAEETRDYRLKLKVKEFTGEKPLFEK